MVDRYRLVVLSCFLLLSAGSQLGAQHGHGEGHHVSSARHDFSDAERWASVFEAEGRDEWQMPGRVVDLMGISPGMTVVDLGAGTGYFLERLRQAVGEEGKVLALDPEPTLIEYIRERIGEQGWSGVEARQIPFDDPGMGSDKADRVLVVDTWHHIENREDYAGRLLESLADGGRIFVVDFTLQSPHGPPVEHRLAAEEVRKELEAGGFDAEILAERLPYQYVVAGAKRSHSG